MVRFSLHIGVILRPAQKPVKCRKYFTLFQASPATQFTFTLGLFATEIRFMCSFAAKKGDKIGLLNYTHCIEH